jgi:hypothetical protein
LLKLKKNIYIGLKTIGVIFKNYKFRFKRLGFTEERFEELDKSERREIGLRLGRNME